MQLKHLGFQLIPVSIHQYMTHTFCRYMTLTRLVSVRLVIFTIYITYQYRALASKPRYYVTRHIRPQTKRLI